MRYLEDLPELTLRSNPYLLAISTYALAMAKSTKKMTFKNLLDNIKKLDGSMFVLNLCPNIFIASMFKNLYSSPNQLLISLNMFYFSNLHITQESEYKQ